jgi:hypothetical protein
MTLGNVTGAKRACVDNSIIVSTENVDGVQSTPKQGIRGVFDTIFK